MTIFTDSLHQTTKAPNKTQQNTNQNTINHYPSSSLGPVANATHVPLTEGLLYYPIPHLRFLDVPTSAARHLHAREARDPSSERWNCVGENVPVILPKWRLPRHSGIFYMPQIYDMGLTALLPLRRKACWGFFRPEKSWRLWPGFNLRTWILKGSTLHLDHRNR